MNAYLIVGGALAIACIAFTIGWVASAIVGRRELLTLQERAERADINGKRALVIARGLRNTPVADSFHRAELDRWAHDLEAIAVAHLECINAIGIDALAVVTDRPQYLGEFRAGALAAAGAEAVNGVPGSTADRGGEQTGPVAGDAATPAGATVEGRDIAGAVDDASRWVTQTKFYDPTQPPDVCTGNCTEAALASLLRLPLDAIPSFQGMQSVEYWEALDAFVESRGFLWEMRQGAYHYPGLYLADGPSSRGCGHFVVMRDGEMVHDPHPSRAGLTSIERTWVLIPADPASALAQAGPRVPPSRERSKSGACERCSRCREGDFANCKNRRLATPPGDDGLTDTNGNRCRIDEGTLVVMTGDGAAGGVAR